MSPPPGPAAAAAGEANRLRALVAPIAAITVFGVSLAMSYPLFALMLDRTGVSGAGIGVNTMAAAIGMVAAAPLMPILLRAVGMGQLLVTAALGLAGILAVVPLVGDYWALTGLRLIYGFAGTVLFFGSEFWIVAAAPEATRGRIVALYALSVSGGFALGPALLKLTGLVGPLPFLAAVGVLLLGLLPMLWGLRCAPRADDGNVPAPLAALAMFVSDPVVVFGAAVFGTVEFGAMALIAVWGVRSGLAESDAALILTVFALGAMVLQMPLGWAADRFDRRWLLVVVALCCTLAPLAMALAAPGFLAVCAAAGFWGATSVGFYTVALTEMGSRYSGSRLAVGNAAVVLAYGFGSLVSPLAFGAAMDAIRPDGLLFASAAVSLAYMGLTLARIRHEARAKPLDSAGRMSR